MVLVAAAAVAVAWTRAIVPEIRAASTFDSGIRAGWQNTLVWWRPVLSPPLMAASAAVVVLARRRRGAGRGRGRGRGRVVWGPGEVACGAAVAALAVVAGMAALGEAIARLTRPAVVARGGDPGEWLLILADDLATVTGYAVTGAWLALGLTRRWRPERGWPGRAGRWLGAAWVGLMVAHAVAMAVR